jgi:molybdate transport system substrate-binding protein
VRRRRGFHHRLLAIATTLLALAAGSASAENVRVMTSGAFTTAYLELVPVFEKATGHTVLSAFGASMGTAPDAIPSRLARGEPVDVVILSDAALDALIVAGTIRREGRTDLVRSSIGMVVRKGAPKPDISTVEALTRTLLSVSSIAYSASASGTYLSTELFPKLGVAERIAGKAKRIESERVAAVVARGDAEIGFQQVSELLPERGADYVGPLPPGAQRVTTFSAGIATASRVPQAAQALIAFLASREAAHAVTRSGLELVR